MEGYCAWSPGGNLLYFISERDGYRCIWAQHLNQKTKVPVGSAIPVHHFHGTSSRLSGGTRNLKLSAARDKLVFPMEEESGNIWMMEEVDQ